MESKEVGVDVLQVENSKGQKNNQQKLVDDSTVQEGVTVHQAHANINTFAANAGSMDIVKKAALSKMDTVYGMQLKYLRYKLWDSEEKNDRSIPFTPLDLADWTKITKPLPTVPLSEFNNAEAVKMVKDNSKSSCQSTSISLRNCWHHIPITLSLTQFTKVYMKGSGHGLTPSTECTPVLLMSH